MPTYVYKCRECKRDVEVVGDTKSPRELDITCVNPDHAGSVKYCKATKVPQIFGFNWKEGKPT